MSYQENIYNQNGKCNRNFVGPVPTTSSDISIFNRPTFVMSGASSIDCPEVTCSISGVPYNDIFTGTTDCFETNALSATCFNSIDWTTNVYEDDVLVYSNAFYSSLSLSGSVIDITTFSGSVVAAFDTLGYTYSFDNEEFTIGKELRFENIKLELTTELDYTDDCQVTGNYTGDTSCSCPSGYTATTGLDSCQKLTYTALTVNGSGPTIVSAGDKNKAHGANGTYFFPIINDLNLPLVRNSSDPSNELREVTTGGASVYSVVNVSSTFWGIYTGSSTPNTYGRLNQVGVKNSGLLTDWVGFSECIDIETSGIYYIGIGANNACRFRLNGELILNLSNDKDANNLKVWHMLPVTLTSGKHIIEMEGRNDDATNATSFGAEIYSESLENLTGSTTTGTTGLIFSSFNRIGTAFDLGELSGNSCPSEYSLDSCGDKSTCVKVESTDITCLFTGSCETNDIICDLDFSEITLSDTNVHLLTGQTEFDLSFEFTGNTETFPDTNAIFKYEIYKYLPELGRFNDQPKYSSGAFEWSSFSGTSAFTTSVTTDSINPDGEYLVKGHFIYDVGTEFANLLGYKNSTTRAKTGEQFGLYQPSRDFYFIALGEAQIPELSNVVDENPIIGNLTVSTIILDSETSEFNFPSTLSDYIISLNGVTLAPDLDYTLGTTTINGTDLTLMTILGPTISGDVLTYAYTSGVNTNNLKSDTFDINTPIVSGITNGEGLNTVYYNSDTDKYEVFISMTPSSRNDILITLNGVSLANGIDYYQSSSNPKRIIFEGDLIVSDIVNAYYNTDTNIVGPKSGTTMGVAWIISNPPTTTDGLFTVEVSEDSDFKTIISSATTQHIIGVTGYSILVDLVGSVGDKQYYRVKNGKNFTTLCNERLTTEVYSEIGNITIQTNINNSY